MSNFDFNNEDNKKKISENDNLHELKDPQKFFQNFFEQPIVGIAVMQDFRLIYINQKAADIIGYSIEEMYNWKANQFFKAINPKDRKMVLNSIEEQIKGPRNKINHTQIQVITKGGKLVWIEIFSKAFFYEDKTAFLGMFLDVSGQKATENKLRESIRKYSTLFETSPNSVLLINKKGKILDINPAVEHLTGYSRDELIGKKYYKLKTILPKDLPKLFERMVKIVGGTPQPPIELQIRRKNEGMVWINLQSTLLQMEDEPLIQVIGHDLSERKKFQQELISSKRGYKEALTRVNFYEDLFTHDMKNILQNILSSVNLLSVLKKNPEKQVEFQEMLDIIEDQSKRGANLISNIQILSDMESKDIELKIINARDVLYDTIKNIKDSFPKKQIVIEIESEEDKFWVKADEFLTSLFESILTNSVQYNENPIIEVQIVISKIKKGEIKYMKFEIIDNGIGIADERKKLILQKAANTKSGIKGGGLGLVLVGAILARYEGDISIKDRIEGNPSKGTNFILLIPTE